MKSRQHNVIFSLFLFFCFVFFLFVWRRHVPFVTFIYLSKFHVSIITGSGVMTIFVYKGFYEKFRNWKPPLLSFVQYLETGAIEDTKFDINVSNEKLIDAAKCHVYIFYRFWVNKGNPTGRRREGAGQGWSKNIPAD